MRVIIAEAFRLK